MLLNPRTIKGHEGIEQVFSCLRALQYDPQNPCGRSIDIFLQARVGKIKPSDYYKWLYKERKGIETYDKELCVIPIDDLPICRGRYLFTRIKKLNDFMKSNKTELDKVLMRIEKYGEICSSDLDDKKSKAALDFLWKMGKVVITRRKNAIKYFNIPKNVYGCNFCWNDDKSINCEQIMRRINCVGLLPSSGTGSGWLGVGIGREISLLIKELIAKNKLAEIKIKDVKNNYVVNYNDLELLKKINTIKFTRKISFLSPLDNLLWDRKMIKDIFDFDYKWEAYTPKKDRKYGHYVLPILYGMEFIGRIEPVLKNNYLEIKGFWAEPNFKYNSNINNAFWKYLESFKEYLNVEKIEWSCKNPFMNIKV